MPRVGEIVDGGGDPGSFATQIGDQVRARRGESRSGIDRARQDARDGDGRQASTQQCPDPVDALDIGVSRWGEEPDSGNGSRTAAEGAELMVVCVEDYEAAVRILGRAEPYLGSRDLVNVTSGTEAQARRLAAWVDARGGRYLDGALMAHPEHVGKPETMLVYSGSHEVFARHERLLGQLGGATYLGPDPGTAALYDVAMLNFAWATLTGYLYSAALLRTAGVRATGTAPLLTHWMSATITSVVTDYAEQIDNGRYPGDEEWLDSTHH